MKWCGSTRTTQTNKKPRLVLDVGAGAHPWPHATHACDCFPEATIHRTESQADTRSLSFIVCDIHYLPFKTGSFEIVYSSHVLEHTTHPQKAITELQRVGKHGIALFPSKLWNWLFLGSCPGHTWHISAEGKHQRIRAKGFAKTILGGLWRVNFRLQFRAKLQGVFARIKHNELRW